MSDDVLLKSLARLKAMKEHFHVIHYKQWAEYNGVLNGLLGLGMAVEEFMLSRDELESSAIYSGYDGRQVSSGTPEVQRQVFQSRISAAIEYLCLKGAGAQDKPDVGELALRSICSNFGRFAFQLTRRHADREPFMLENEYDVQDVLHAVLRLFFDDVRPEETTPSHAGKHALMDFLVPEVGTVIEAKYVRDRAHGKKVNEEIIVDVARYKPRCHLMLALIYDPKKHIDNPKGVISDLANNSSDDMEVCAFICN